MLFIVSNLLFRVAKDARDTAEKEDVNYQPNRILTTFQPLQNASLSSIVFSTTSIEAYLNELTQIMLQPVILTDSDGVPNGNQPQTPDISGLASTLQDMEQKRRPAWQKFDAIRERILGSPYDSTRPPMQDLRMLLRLRNDLIHHKPLDEFEITGLDLNPRETVKDLENFQGGRLLAGRDPKVDPFVNIISSNVMAGWACNTAFEMISSSIDLIGDAHLKAYLQHEYLKNEFKRP